MRLVGWALAIVAVVVVGFSIISGNGPPTEDQLREQAGLIGKDRLYIGVKDDTPGIAFKDENGEFSGFDIDIALLVAEGLGFHRDQVEFLAIETEDRGRMQAKNQRGEHMTVDLVVATFSVTPERERDKEILFSTPYLKTEQSVVTLRTDETITSLTQLRGRKVCTLGSSTSATALREAGVAVKDIKGENQISACFDGLRRGDYAAVSTDAAIMAGFVAADPNLRHHDIGLSTTESWAINVGGGRHAMRTLVDLALYRSFADPRDDRWERAYRNHITPLLKHNPGINVAQNRQPCVPKPQVRRWPWERDNPPDAAC